MDFLSNLSDENAAKVTQWAINIVGAILILIAGRIAAGIGRMLVKGAMKRGGSEESLMKFVGNIIYYLIFIFAAVDVMGPRGKG